MKHQKYIKNIFKVLIMCLIFFAFFQTKVNAVTREQAEKALVKVAKEIIEIGKKNKILEYNNGKKRESLRKWELVDGKLCADCGSFVGAVYKYVFGEISTPIDINEIDKSYDVIDLKGFDIIYNLSESNLRPGDIICKQSKTSGSSSGRHAYMYIGDGKEAEAGGGTRINGNTSIKN